MIARANLCIAIACAIAGVGLCSTQIAELIPVALLNGVAAAYNFAIWKAYR